MSSESVPDRGWCVPAGHVGDRKNPALLPVVQCLRKPDQLDVNWNMNSFTGSAEEAALACERTVWMDQALIEGLGAGLADDKRRSKQAVVQLVMQLGPWMRQQNLLQDTWTGEGRPPPGMAAVKRIKTCKGPSPRPVKGYLFRGHDSCRVEVIDGGPGAHSTSTAVDHDPQQLGGQGTPGDTTHSRAVEDGLPVALPGTKRLLEWTIRNQREMFTTFLYLSTGDSPGEPEPAPQSTAARTDTALNPSHPGPGQRRKVKATRRPKAPKAAPPLQSDRLPEEGKGMAAAWPLIFMLSEAKQVAEKPLAKQTTRERAVTAVYTHCPEVLARPSRIPSDSIMLLVPGDHMLWTMQSFFPNLILHHSFLTIGQFICIVSHVAPIIVDFAGEHPVARRDMESQRSLRRVLGSAKGFADAMLGAWDVVDMETVTFPKTLELVVYCFKTLLLLHQHKDPAPPDEEWEVTNKDPDMSEELKDHTVDLMFAALGTLAPHIPGLIGWSQNGSCSPVDFAELLARIAPKPSIWYWHFKVLGFLCAYKPAAAGGSSGAPRDTSPRFELKAKTYASIKVWDYQGSLEAAKLTIASGFRNQRCRQTVLQFIPQGLQQLLPPEVLESEPVEQTQAERDTSGSKHSARYTVPKLPSAKPPALVPNQAHPTEPRRGPVADVVDSATALNSNLMNSSLADSAHLPNDLAGGGGRNGSPPGSPLSGDDPTRLSRQYPDTAKDKGAEGVGYSRGNKPAPTPAQGTTGGGGAAEAPVIQPGQRDGARSLGDPVTVPGTGSGGQLADRNGSTPGTGPLHRQGGEGNHRHADPSALEVPIGPTGGPHLYKEDLLQHGAPLLDTSNYTMLARAGQYESRLTSHDQLEQAAPLVQYSGSESTAVVRYQDGIEGHPRSCVIETQWQPSPSQEERHETALQFAATAFHYLACWNPTLYEAGAQQRAACQFAIIGAGLEATEEVATALQQLIAQAGNGTVPARHADSEDTE